MSRLDQLLEAAREDVERRKQQTPPESLVVELGTRTGSRPFKEALVQPGLSVIAEFKRSSPSEGEIRPGSEVSDVVSGYERGGAAALSILTEGRRFDGSLEDLRAARAASRLPILRKDFTVDPYQLWEASVAGADAVLLIVAGLADEDLKLLYDEAQVLDLDCVVEVHDEQDLERALLLDPDVIGINNRNLGTLEVDTETTHRLLHDVPAGKTVVAESGYDTREELEELDRIGIDAVLIGTSLMRAEDPEAKLEELTLAEGLSRDQDLEDPEADS